MTLEADRDRGERAKRLLEGDLMVEAFTALEAALHDAWTGSKTPEERERLWAERQAMIRFKGHFEQAVNTGKLAARQLAEAEEKAKRKRKAA